MPSFTISLCAPTALPAWGEGLLLWDPAAQVRSPGRCCSVPVCIEGSGSCFVTSLIHPSAAFLTQLAPGSTHVFNPENIKHERGKKKEREMPTYEYALTGCCIWSWRQEPFILSKSDLDTWAVNVRTLLSHALARQV